MLMKAQGNIFTANVSPYPMHIRPRPSSPRQRNFKTLPAVEGRTAKRDNLARDAEWTARYQKGEQVFEIAVGMKRYKDCEQTVYRAVERFATFIGLNLRRVRKRRDTKN